MCLSLWACVPVCLCACVPVCLSRVWDIGVPRAWDMSLLSPLAGRPASLFLRLHFFCQAFCPKGAEGASPTDQYLLRSFPPRHDANSVAYWVLLLFARSRDGKGFAFQVLTVCWGAGACWVFVSCRLKLIPTSPSREGGGAGSLLFRPFLRLFLPQNYKNSEKD